MQRAFETRPLTVLGRSISDVARVPRTLRKSTETASARDLVELRGHALKNYGGLHMPEKSRPRRAMTKSDRSDPMLDREVNELSTAVKSVHLHHLVLVEFDGSRGNRKVARNLLRRTPLREQL